MAASVVVVELTVAAGGNTTVRIWPYREKNRAAPAFSRRRPVCYGSYGIKGLVLLCHKIVSLVVSSLTAGATRQMVR